MVDVTLHRPSVRFVVFTAVEHRVRVRVDQPRASEAGRLLVV